MDDDKIRMACEMAFQAGGPKTFLIHRQNWWVVPVNGVTAKRASELAVSGEEIWARRKVRGERRYEWKHIK